MENKELEYQKMRFLIDSTDKEFESFIEEKMTVDILDDILSYCVENNFILLFNLFIDKFKSISDEIMRIEEENSRNIKIPENVLKNLDDWYLDFKNTHLK